MIASSRPSGAAVVLLGLAAANLAALWAALVLGELAVGPIEALRALTVPAAERVGTTFVVTDLRLPRALVAGLAGAALGVAGTLLQGITRNPLAAPSVLGLTQGASLAAVVAVVFVPTLGMDTVSLLAFVGAGAASLLLYLLAWRGGLPPSRLLLVGIGLAAIGTALVTLTITIGDLHRVERALVWMMGSVQGAEWSSVTALAPWVLVVAPLTLTGARALDVLGLGDDVARELGASVTRTRATLMAGAVALTGAAVAAAGTVTFIGLMAPHLARRLVGPRSDVLLPTSALVGALILIGADIVARTALAPIELPCGVVTAVLGAPFFVYLLLRQPTRAVGSTPA